MTARAWAFQQGILWAMEFSRVAPGGSAPDAGSVPVYLTERTLTQDVGRVVPGGSGPHVRSAPVRAAESRVPATVGPRVAADFAESGRESSEPLARAMDLPESSVVALRFETGRRCFVGRLENEIVTYGWVSQCDESVGELERDYRMRPGDAYIWDCATLPGHRGQGLYGALLNHITRTLHDEGVPRAWIGANLENVPSLRAFARAGFQPVVRVAYARLLRLRCLWLLAQPGAPAELVDCARGMLTAPYERAWRMLIVGVRPRS
jgi:GNAT superfamily N-acetyltransferase